MRIKGNNNNNIIIHINSLLSDELIAVNQYFLHSKIFDNWGLKKLSSFEYKECMDELDHAGIYTKRILFLGDIPVVSSVGSVKVKNNLEDILRIDLDLEYRSVDKLRNSIMYADSIQDYVSKDMMINILKDEEKHIHFLETELELIQKMGIHNYVQSQLKIVN